MLECEHNPEKHVVGHIWEMQMAQRPTERLDTGVWTHGTCAHTWFSSSSKTTVQGLVQLV